MRKRSGRPPRFAAVPNETIDDALALDFMALALLSVLIRHRDGWEITLAEIGAKYGYGRDAMAAAMGLLQVARYVVKIRMMSKVGGLWSTEVYVFDTPATDQEVAALLAQVEKDTDVRRASVIEPTADALEKARKRRAKLAPKQGRTAPSVVIPRVQENPYSDVTSGNEASPQVVPECRDFRQSVDPAVFKKTVGKKTREKTDAPAGRSPVDGRSPSTSGSRGAGGEGGSAASGKTKPSPTTSKTPASGRKAKHTKAQLDIVRQVRAYYPPEFGNDLPELPTISDAILSAMATDGRTPEQIGEQILYRWLHHGYAEKFHTGTLENPVGAAVGMVRPLRRGDRYACADPRCENGRDKDTGEECRLCAVRAADWKAAQARKRQQRGTQPSGPLPSQRATAAGPAYRECVEPSCRRPIMAREGDPYCAECRADAAAAQEAAAAVLAAWEEQAAAQEGPAVDPAPIVDHDAAETSRLRARLAARYGTPDQVDAYCNAAPF